MSKENLNLQTNLIEANIKILSAQSEKTQTEINVSTIKKQLEQEIKHNKTCMVTHRPMRAQRMRDFVESDSDTYLKIIIKLNSFL